MHVTCVGDRGRMDRWSERADECRGNARDQEVAGQAVNRTMSRTEREDDTRKLCFADAKLELQCLEKAVGKPDGGRRDGR